MSDQDHYDDAVDDITTLRERNRVLALSALKMQQQRDDEKAAHAETRRLLEKAHNEGRSGMEYADELKDSVFAAEAEIATLTAQRDAATSAVNHMSLVQLKLQQDLAAAEKVCEGPVIALYTECCEFLRKGDDWPVGAMHSSAPHQHSPVQRLVSVAEWRRTKEGS